MRLNHIAAVVCPLAAAPFAAYLSLTPDAGFDFLGFGISVILLGLVSLVTWFVGKRLLLGNERPGLRALALVPGALVWVVGFYVLLMSAWVHPGKATGAAVMIALPFQFVVLVVGSAIVGAVILLSSRHLTSRSTRRADARG